MLRMCRTLSSAFMATLVVLSLASLTAVLAASEYVVEKNTVRLVLPAGLSSEYNDLLKFDAAYGDFGEIPYDQVLNYEIMLPPGDLVNQDNFEACGLPASKEQNATVVYKGLKYPKPSSPNHLRAALIDRGTCKYIEKTYNAQKANADLVLVVDNKNETLKTLVSPKDNEYQDGWVYNLVNALTIPTLLVTNEIGNQLKNLAKNETVVVKIDFSEVFERRSRVSLEYWTTSSQLTDVDKQDQEFKGEFKGIAKNLVCGDDDSSSAGCVDFRPRYLFSTCCDGLTSDDCCIHQKDDPTKCALTEDEIVAAASEFCHNSCYKFGRYCAEDPEYDTTVGYSGKDVVMENLRAAAVFINYGSETWWQYSSSFFSSCKIADQNFDEACSYKVMKKLGIDSDTIEQVLGNESDNTPLPVAEEELQAKEAEADCNPVEKGCQGAVIYTPVLEINDDKYNGKLGVSPVLAALCSAFELDSAPAACSSLNSNGSKKGLGGGAVAAIVIFSILGTIAVLALVYRYVAKMHMDREIRAIMAEYVSLDSENPKSSDAPAKKSRAGNGFLRTNKFDDDDDDDDDDDGDDDDVGVTALRASSSTSSPGNGVRSNNADSKYSFDLE